MADTPSEIIVQRVEIHALAHHAGCIFNEKLLLAHLPVVGHGIDRRS